MKLNKRISHEMRKRLDDQLARWRSVEFFYRPRKGWVKSIRESLGMSSRQLAHRLDKSNSDILAIEKREVQGKVTLETMEKMAEALDCQFVYALLPHADSLEEKLEFEAKKVAEKIVNSTYHSMGLENQKTSEKIMKDHIKDLAHELKAKLDPRIWNQK